MPKRRITVHKQPPRTYRVSRAPVQLADDFAFVGGGVAVQGDDPITTLHVHNCLEVGYCFDGRGIFVIENKVFPFSAGDVCIVNDCELHLAQSAPDTVSHWTWMMMDPVRLVGVLPQGDCDKLRTGSLCGSGFANMMTARNHPEIVDVTRRIVAEAQTRSAGYRAAIRALVWQLMVLLHRVPRGSSRQVGGAAIRHGAGVHVRQSMGRIAPALAHLTRHSADPIAIPELAAQCHTSVTNFRRLFRQATGQSPLHYLTNLRLQMASTLLTGTQRKVLDISQTVGYETLSSFNRHFHNHFGMSPRQWRRGGAK